MRIDSEGSRSDGFSTNVLPQRDRDRKHPQRHHRGKIERRDAGAHADRLAQRKAVDLRADVFAEFALEQVRNAGGELDDFDAARDLALGIGQRLAVFFA